MQRDPTASLGVIGVFHTSNRLETNMDHTFFALLFRQRYIRRWGLMRNSYDENLAEHSAEAAILTHALATIGNEIFHKHYDVGAAVTYALYHDAAEILTGDLPTPVKYFNKATKESYSVIEQSAIDSMLEKLPCELVSAYDDILRRTSLDPELKRLVKAADKLCAYIKCVEETKIGNADFSDALKTTYAVLQQYECEELSYFMEHFLPAFTATIDSL